MPASLANSSGVFLPARPHYDLVRPGYALYGGNPTPGRENPMRPVATLEIAVQQTRWIEPGETCGYNARWTARRRTRLATLLAGYADGLPIGAGATDSRAGRRGADRRAHVPAGRADVDGPLHRRRDLSARRGGRAGRAGGVFGPNAALDTFAAKAGTIGYNVLTALGARYERVDRSGRE